MAFRIPIEGHVIIMGTVNAVYLSFVYLNIKFYMKNSFKLRLL